MKTIFTPSATLSRHDNLKLLWANYHGLKGTPRQLARIRLTEEQLERQLDARNISLARA